MVSKAGLTVVSLCLAFSLLAPVCSSMRADTQIQHKIAALPSPPQWPQAYEVAYTLELPYIASVQSKPVKYPVHVWYDGKAGMMRESVYDGMDETYTVPGMTYQVYPRIDERSCLVMDNDVGPRLTAAGADMKEVIPGPLPDISGWSYGGPARLPGKPASHVWQLQQKMWEKVNTYTFHVAQDTGAPLHLSMIGVNLFTGSHYDQYEVDFTLYRQSLSQETKVFQPPTECDGVQPDPDMAAKHRLITSQAHSLLPSNLIAATTTSSNTESGNAGSVIVKAILQTLSRLGVRLDSFSEGSSTLSVAEQNMAFVDRFNAQRQAERKRHDQAVLRAVHNGMPVDVMHHVDLQQDAKSPVHPYDAHTLGATKFMTYSDDTWRATSLGVRKGSKRQSSEARLEALRKSPAYLGMYKRQLSDEALPKDVDWRGSGADGAVKDQASCGSCWTFATTGAMTGAWFKATGQALSFSEQQIVDCSWDYEVDGCWGGEMQPALEYINKAGGAILESDYPYVAQNAYCKDTKLPKAAVFKGYMEVPARDEKALMEAVALHGPVAISFDAGHIDFKYYTEGVYYNPECSTEDLDHAVVLVGYGTTWNGTDYWLLRNSWSSQWGLDGYFRLARKGNDCGITTNPVMAVVDTQAANKFISRKGKKADQALP